MIKSIVENILYTEFTDVVNAKQARIAEEAGACAVMALERVPADIRWVMIYVQV